MVSEDKSTIWHTFKVMVPAEMIFAYQRAIQDLIKLDPDHPIRNIKLDVEYRNEDGYIVKIEDAHGQ